MTVRVERTFEVPVPPADVWAFISDPERRARAISVVREFEVTGEKSARWHVKLPIPIVDRTVAVDTEEVERRDGEYVRFVGTSTVMRVQGEHELEPTDGGTRVVNRFLVDGRLPGVERFFQGNLDEELENLEAALREELEVQP
jgi:carbon monoxide dehydrogenase subunit G